MAKYKEVQEGVHMIAVIIDSFDNQVNYIYEKIDEVVYIKSIGYGGTSQLASKYFINFNYKNRKVSHLKYVNGKAMSHRRVLNDIVVTLPNNTLKAYRTYSLLYDNIQENTLERLIQINISNEENQQLPSLKFGYTNKDSSVYVQNEQKEIQMYGNIKQFGSVVVGDFFRNW